MSEESKSNKPYEFARVLVLSTGHIREEDDDLLSAGASPVVSYAKMIPGVGVVGAWVSITQSDSSIGFVGLMDCAMQAGYSKEFVNLLWLARKLDCQWLMLDCDGPKRDDLPWFDW
jgi:hypothetical protein